MKKQGNETIQVLTGSERMFKVEVVMADYVVWVEDPTLQTGGWWFGVRVDRSKRYGPYVTERDARAAREQLFARWNRAARRLGGWMWKGTHERWHLTLPAGHPVHAPRMANAPCSLHAATARPWGA
jgi:hypothetical protein